MLGDNSPSSDTLEPLTQLVRDEVPLATNDSEARMLELERQLGQIKGKVSVLERQLLRIKTFFAVHLAFLTSLALHAAILLVIAMIPHAVRQMTEAMREQVIIPEAAIIEGAAVGGIPNPGLGGDPNLSSAQNVDPGVSVADGWASKRSESLTAALMSGGASDATDSVIGLGVRSGLVGSGGRGAGGDGGEAGGAMAPFGPPGGGMGLGPQAPFIGISGNARRVVYICDASGTMMGVFPRVRFELQKAIDVLKPVQAFNVIFFNEELTPLSKDALVMATPENKRKAIAMAQGTAAASSTEPLGAIRLAFSQKPELIYVLTDGFDQTSSFEVVINEFRKLNPDRKVKVNIILIKSTIDPDLEKVGRDIARENGGVCKIIDKQDM